MLSRAKFLRLTGLTAAALAISPEALPKSNDGIVRVKSIYPFAETIERLKKDIAAKGIRFFSEIDQAKLAVDAGIKLDPSTLLVFGNPPLGTQFIAANPDAGLDWMAAVQSGRFTRTSPGSLRVTASSTARSNSNWSQW